MNYRLHGVVLFLVVSLFGCTITPGMETLSQWRVKADQAYQAQDYSNALNYYKKLSEAVPAEAELWFRLGNTLARLNRTDEAVKAYREALLRDTRFSKAWYNTGLNQLRASSETFSESLRYIPKTDPVYQIAESYNQKLILLMAEQNAALTALTEKSERKSIDVQSVEMIVLDGKPGSLSGDTPESHDELREALAQPNVEIQSQQSELPATQAPVQYESDKAGATHQQIIDPAQAPVLPPVVTP